jgi:hypothetical protein
MVTIRLLFLVSYVGMDGKDTIIFSAQDLNASGSITANRDRFAGARTARLGPGDDITVGARWQAGLQSHIPKFTTAPYCS